MNDLSIEIEAHKINREINLHLLRASWRESDSFCGDGVSRGRCFASHGFGKRPKMFGCVATADLETEE